MIDVKNGGWFWIRMTVRLLSIVAAFFTTKWFSLAYGLYAYFMTSVVLDVLFFKVLRLKESNFKRPGYFKHALQNTPAHYDRYVSSVVNAKAVTFLLAHSVFLVSYFKEPMEVINVIFMVVLTTVVFRYGFKFGYHQFKKDVGGEEIKYHPSPIRNEHIGHGMVGWKGSIYTGNSSDIGS